MSTTRTEKPPNTVAEPIGIVQIQETPNAVVKTYFSRAGCTALLWCCCAFFFVVTIALTIAFPIAYVNRN
jgi:integral membrane sensor domain MASE1